jgi:hypothetical protein
MNQFNNIGSMFPGAQFKGLRERAKATLTMDGQPEIVGLVIKNAAGDLTIIEEDKIQTFKLGEVEIIKAGEIQRIMQIAAIECEYWKNVADKDPTGECYGIEGMAAAGNILAAIILGISPDEFKKRKEEFDGQPKESSDGDSQELQ